MRRSTLIAAVAAVLVLGGCSADPLNIIILNARAPGDKCDFSDNTLYVSRGSLDFRPGAVAGYYQVFSWENQLQPNPISVNGQVVDPGGGNDFIGDSVVYEYQYSDPNVALAAETQNARAVISAAGTPDKNSVGADLIQPKAYTAILNSIGTSTQTLVVTFQIFGSLAAGTSKHTNKVSFPLTVYQTDTVPITCPPGQKLLVGSCNAPGRDAPVQCVPAS